MRLISIVLASIVPIAAFGLDYSNRSLLYTDAPFSPAESAGISVLTAVGAVEGNPDGTFRPSRTLNRAEFLKIVLLSYPNIRVSSSDARNCFPDVPKDAWFSKYVCLAQRRGIVAGYPDGDFKPENSVNYAEALKILGELYNYTAYADPDAPWYAMYAQAAQNHKTNLPINLPYHQALTRGQMARLAAAYLAERENELLVYRSAEQGQYLSSSVSQSLNEDEVEDADSVEKNEKSNSQYSSTPISDVQIQIAESHLLTVGAETDLLADGRFVPRDEDVYVRIVKVQLRREIRSLESLTLVDEFGTPIGDLSLSVYDSDNKTWRIDYPIEDAPVLTGKEPRVFAVRGALKEIGKGGISGEHLEVVKITFHVQETESNTSYELLASVPHFPTHVTVVGTVSGAENALESEGVFDVSKDSLIGVFTFTGSTMSDAFLEIRELSFTMEASDGVAVSGWELGAPGMLDRYSCSTEDRTRINCVTIPSDMGALKNHSVELRLYGNVILGGVEEGRTLQVNLVSPGSYNALGDVRWTDGTTDINWIETTEPVVEGTVWILQ